MRHFGMAALCALAIAGGAAGLAPRAAGAQEAGPALAEAARQVTVTGTGSEARAPDMAVLRLGVSAEADEAAAAMGQAAEAMQGIMAVLKEAGIDPRDIQTSQLTLAPLREGRSDPGAPLPPLRFRADSRLQVRLRELDRLGELLDAVVQDGANAFDGLSFALQDPEPARDAARRAAVADAMRKARLYAEAAGVELGPVLSISEAGGGGPGPVPMMMEARAMPVAEGEVSYDAAVTMVFALR